ncbi:P-loop containing nucleoside triphosphate hydrolase protein [Jackrogersella minutella]|nr:P-loop containing nucleoside triphosphate hydrolase protein [Jackrogersella minutella]
MSTTEIFDDKSDICIPFIEKHRSLYAGSDPGKPFIVALSGVQGAGKSTLVKALASKLEEEGHLKTLVCSIDDFYLRHEDQKALAASQPDNSLVQVRGEPGTHDMNLLRDFFTALCKGEPVKVPQYDKSAHGGQGDRVPESQWETINGPGQPKTQAVIFEGWCVGFRHLNPGEMTHKWNASSRTLHKHSPEHLNFINERLKEYDVITNTFDVLIHIDAEDTEFVYDWRLQQEAMLRKQRGAGMTDDQVVEFVDAYYPAYELFLDKLRDGIFLTKPGRQLRLIVGKDRKVKQTVIL